MLSYLENVIRSVIVFVIIFLSARCLLIVHSRHRLIMARFTNPIEGVFRDNKHNFDEFVDSCK